MKMTPPAKNVDDYLAAVPATARTTLKKIRRSIKEVAPDATEKISYGMPSFYYLGPLVAYAAFKDHCSLFPMSVSAMETHKPELKDYDTSKGTIRFAFDAPLPSTLVKRLVKERIRENEAKAQRRTEKRSQH